MKHVNGKPISASNIDDYIRGQEKDAFITWTPDEWCMLGANLSSNGFTVEFMGRKHNMDLLANE